MDCMKIIQHKWVNIVHRYHFALCFASFSFFFLSFGMKMLSHVGYQSVVEGWEAG